MVHKNRCLKRITQNLDTIKTKELQIIWTLCGYLLLVTFYSCFLCLSVWLCLSVCVVVFICLSGWFCLSADHIHLVSLSVSAFHPLSLCKSVCLSVSVCFFLCFCLSLSLCVCLSPSDSLSLSRPLSLIACSFYTSLSVCLSVSLSLFLFQQVIKWPDKCSRWQQTVSRLFDLNIWSVTSSRKYISV